MPGIWEIEQANQVLVGILHTDVVTMHWAFGLRNLIIPGREDLRMWEPFLPVTGMPYDHARNTIVAAALTRLYCKYVFFLDSDVVAPKDTILRLMAHNLPICSGLYFRRSPPHAVPVMIKNGGWYVNYPRGQMFDVELVGAGCLLVKTEVFQKLPPMPPHTHIKDEKTGQVKVVSSRGKPWFDWRVDQSGLVPPGRNLSEDFAWNLHCRENGYKIVVDSSILCKHVGYAEAGDGTFNPAEVRVSV